MDTIRLTCPACKAALEVDADKAGTQVECGECFQVFEAPRPDGPKIKVVLTLGPPTGKKKPRPTGRKREDDDRRDEYDEDDYDPNEARGGRPSGMPSAGGTFVLGLLAMMATCVPFVSIPLAIVTLRRPPRDAYPPWSSGLVRYGKLFAQASLGLWVVVLLILYLKFRN
jgi:predicted Zn finger-like uncharacterized protein